MIKRDDRAGVVLPRCDGERAPAADSRRRQSLFRRLFYREDPFVVLGAAELAAVFEAFACVVDLHPAALYWVRRLGDREYLVSDFLHRSMTKYAGLEVVHVLADEIAYYRLPGAKTGGRGRTEPGAYALCLQARGRNRHYLRIRKCEFGLLHVDEICMGPAQDAGVFVALQRHSLDRSKFAEEMKAVVERAVEWNYQRARAGAPDRLREADWIEMTAKCAGLTAKADALLAACAELRKAQP